MQDIGCKVRRGQVLSMLLYPDLSSAVAFGVMGYRL